MAPTNWPFALAAFAGGRAVLCDNPDPLHRQRPHPAGPAQALAKLQAQGLTLAGLEIDHDAGVARLPGYQAFLAQLRNRLPSTLALSITALPSWLGSRELPALLATVDSSQLQVGESVEVGLRPEHCEVLPAGVAPAADDTALDAEITLVEHLGESNLLYLKMDDGQELIVRGDGNAEVRLGDSVIVRAAPSALYLFRADGMACTRLNPGNMRSAHAR